MMNNTDMIKLRLAAQQLAGTVCKTPREIVRCFGAMQAQDYAMVKWAVGLRLDSSEQLVEEAINNAEVIRTHILRPTWHLVSADDIHWMLELTAPHVKKITSSMCRKYDLDDKALMKYYRVIEKSLVGNKHLTRDEIIRDLKNDHSAQNIRSSLIMMCAELEGLVCNGVMRGKQITYALLDERVPRTNTFTKEEGFALLAKKYFTSHGPATLQDFIWWSGFSVSNAKTALELIKSELQTIQIENQAYWFSDTILHKRKISDSIHLLPAFDEFIISYKDRTASISRDNQPKAFTKNGIFNPIIVVNGEVVGTWKRIIKKDTVVVEIKPFKQLENNQGIILAANLYGKYLGKTPEIR